MRFKTTYGVKSLEVRRIMSRAQATHSVVLTFQGSVLPRQVFLGYLVLNVKLYVPRPLRCFQCQRFGHIHDKCRGSVRCPTCGGPHEVADCVWDMKCCNCGRNHSAEFKGCSEYQEAQVVL